jgi:lysophospholipase L1-like esterase
VAARESSASTDPHVALIGASYAAGWSDLRIAGFTVRNYGRGGANTTQMLESLRKLEDAPERPRAVILWGFINEFSQSGLQNLPEVHARVQRNWLEMIAIVERLGAVVILATEVTLRHPEGFGNDTMNFIGALTGKMSYQQRINAEVMKANVWVRKLGRERQLTVLDLQPLIADEDGYRIKKYAQPDGGHLSAEAYRTLTARMTPVIGQALR